MRVHGIGADIIECSRIAGLIAEHGSTFLQRVFTADEILYCQRRRAAVERFSGRFAGKEAVMKALGTGWSRGIAWTDIEIWNDESGRPMVRLTGAAADFASRHGVTSMLISISHCHGYATAYALATCVEA